MEDLAHLVMTVSYLLVTTLLVEATRCWADMAMINVDASVTMGGQNQIFSGGSDGYDTIQLVEGVREDNGVEVDQFWSKW